MTALAKSILDIEALRSDAATDEQARLVLGDLYEERGEIKVADLLRDRRTGPQVVPGLHRPEVMRLWLDQLPQRENKKTRKRIETMTDAEREKMPEWAQRWCAVGLSTAKADRPMFEAAVSACYRFAGLKQPHVVWCNSPIEAAIAGPIASYLLYGRKFANEIARYAVGDAVGGAVRGAVGDAVDGAVGGAVGGAVRGAVDGAVRDAVGGAVGGAVRDAVDGAVRGAGMAGEPSPNGFSREDVQDIKKVLSDAWWRVEGGQFWVGSYYWYGSPSVTSFFFDVMRLDLGKDMELRARAYAATASSACWWWPGKDFVLVSERPSKLELAKVAGYNHPQLRHAQWKHWEVRR